MYHKFIAILLGLALAVSLTACGSGEETTVYGMVVSVDGTVISLMEMDGQMGGSRFPGGENGEMPTRPEGMEDFDPEEMPEGFGPGGEMPPEGERPEMGSFEGMEEATTLDIANAHISVEIEGGKESGSMENLVPGAMVTVTIDAKGNATYVLVSQPMGFGGFNFPAAK